MKEVNKLLVFFVIGILLFSPLAIAQDETATNDDLATENQISPEETQNSGEDATIQTPEEIQTQDIEFDKSPGLTSDSPFYFIDDLLERPGDNPRKALDYKEEKIAEAKAMIEKGKPEKAQQVLEKALEYGDILEKEVSPEIKERTIKSSEQIINVLEDLKEHTSAEGIEETFENNIAQEENIAVAAELASKINKLCLTLAKLDPLQYSDVCKSGKDSPRWRRERDRDLTKEQEKQAKIFFDKLSVCFKNPQECDCKGMGVQSFENFCEEQSANAALCFEGNEESCAMMGEGADPSGILPEYLLGIFYDVEGEFSKSKFENFMPKECEKAGATSPKDCEKIMFKLYAPQECIDAGLDGSSAEDEKKCSALMFKSNSPKECIDAGINSEDADAPRKCGKLMFQKNAPSQCLEAGLTGERRDDEAKCKQLMQGKGQFRERNTAQFNKDCNAIADAGEKMKCYEQFYNNAQAGFSDEFMERELNTREFAAKMGAANPNNPCPDGVCDQYERSHPEACPEDCGGERRQGESESDMRGCQSQQQIERLKQDCKNQGEDARVEDRGGCPWVVCVSISQGRTVQQERTIEQDFNVYGNFNPYVKVDRQEPAERMESGDYQPPQRDEQPPGCEGLAPDCGLNSAPYCQDGRTWVCPTTESPQEESGPGPEPVTETTTTDSTTSESSTETTTSESSSTESSSGGGSAPITGEAIFWDYYFK